MVKLILKESLNKTSEISYLNTCVTQCVLLCTGVGSIPKILWPFSKNISSHSARSLEKKKNFRECGLLFLIENLPRQSKKLAMTLLPSNLFIERIMEC